MRALTGFPIDEADLAAQPNLRHRERDEVTASDFRFRTASWQQRDPHLERDRPFDSLEARQRDENIRGNVVLLEEPQDAIAHMRRIVVRDDRLASAFRQRDLA